MKTLTKSMPLAPQTAATEAGSWGDAQAGSDPGFGRAPAPKTFPRSLSSAAEVAPGLCVKETLLHPGQGPEVYPANSPGKETL